LEMTAVINLQSAPDRSRLELAPAYPSMA